ncbi:YihY/virulence factor BrkB family protein [Chelatococcus asaccharovorans]|uniref:Membrane protein n=1 Tax=Chelatococcus asaccharovorans TaxID=28210 RepID=A0A2V3U608_9HYPH|nr:YihY/virulence factor BrkB family protein [Chelatococcus asaccharovorans]MBS7704087.1 YihY/virulence factor BrkB family protein [Chelatococcus asaccharovorans]PXW58253.1 membrane protein [Chelatococcus asaccharovorans]CAH1666323.1 Ribonuclease BN [Chelatococcus asaccharovorans]CAH1681538.1 Ribonuclease BN [Chelatococcus asaccharovorans]
MHVFDPDRAPKRLWTAMAVSALNGLRERGEASRRVIEETGLRPRPSIWSMIWRLVDRISRDNLSLVAAGVAFYAMLAIFPALGVFVSLFGLVADPKTVEAQILSLSALLPAEAIQILLGALHGVVEKNTSRLNTGLVIGLAIALFSARTGMSSLMTGLNIAYDRKEARGIVHQQVVALALTLGGMIFGVVSILAIAAVPAVLAFLPVADDIRTPLLLIRWPFLAVFTMLGFTIIYYAAPCHHVRWTSTIIGSVLATALWLIGSALFSAYVTRIATYDATYGSLGAVVVLLLWLWLTALALLIGAEINTLRHDRDYDLVETKTRAP